MNQKEKNIIRMPQYTKILFFVFLSQFSILNSQFIFAQTDTLTNRSDTSGQKPITTTPPDTAKTSPDTTIAAATTTPADTTPKPVPPQKLIAQFDTNKLVIQQGEIISKILMVINGTEKENTFSINLTYPGEWKALTNTNRTYTIQPGDTFFIPVRIVPAGKILGNTKYLINAYILNENGVPVTGTHFLVEKPKFINWDMNISPEEKIYLMNDQNEAYFSVNLLNTGNEQQELLLDMSNYRKDRLALMDTNGRILKKPFYTFNLKQLQDTNFYFRAKYANTLRNYRGIDIDSYRPNVKGEAQKYSIYAQSRESALTGVGSMFKGKKIDFIRLSDEIKVNPYSYNAMPLMVNAIISNILGAQPIMGIQTTGNYALNNGAYLNYSTNTYFLSPFASTQSIINSFFTIGYYDKKFNMQVGNVAGGRGINANYNISRRQSVGGFISRGPRLLGPADRIYFGLNHQISFTKFRIGNAYTHYTYINQNLNSDFLRTNVSYNFNQSHTITAGGTISRNVSTAPGNPFTRIGYALNGGYSGKFFGDRLLNNISGTYYSKNFSGFLQGAWWNVINNSNLYFKDWNIFLFNYYQNQEQTPLITQRTFSNTATFNRKVNKVNIAPSIFYNISNTLTNGVDFRFHSRGLQFGYSVFDYETNRMASVNVRAGYNKLIDVPNLGNFFFLQLFSVYKYRVWSGNFRYTYGTTSPDLNAFSGVYPQTVSASVNYQHQFKNPHFLLMNNATYNYFNRFNRHSISYTPQLYYYTNNGWRFYIQPGYYFSLSKKVNNNPNRVSFDESQEKISVSQGFVINAGVRKIFGIPTPWRKVKYPSVSFFAFIDHNGNNIQDAGEISLENVVIKLGDEWEVLTNEMGKAAVKNVFGDSVYTLSAFSLVDLKGYFPNIPYTISAVQDSTYNIPFVKGVKIHGNVFLDREKIAAGSEQLLDLSGIKITALNGKAVHTLTDGKGEFSFYVPFGKYTISMDERVLGDRFTIMQNNIEIELDQKTESIFITFFIVERRRKISVKKFNENGEQIKDSTKTIQPKQKSLEELKKEEELKKQEEQKKKQQQGGSPGSPGKNNKNQPDSSKTGSPAKKGSGKTNTTETQIDKSQIRFKVQIGAYNLDVSPDILEKIKAIPDIKESKTDEGLTRYTAGEFVDYESAQILRQELIQKGISTDTTFVIIIADYKGRILTADEAKELLKD